MTDSLSDLVRSLRARAHTIASARLSAAGEQAAIRTFGIDARDQLSRQPIVQRELNDLVARCLSDDPVDRAASAWEIVHSLDSISMAVSGTDPSTAAPQTIGQNVTAWTLAAIAVFAAIAWYALRNS